MVSINSGLAGRQDHDRRWWVPAVAVVPILLLTALIDAVGLFLLLWSVSDGCDPQGPANGQASHQASIAAGIATGLVCAALAGALSLPHRRTWRTARVLLAALATVGSLWPATWSLLAYQQAGVHFTGCH